MSAWPSAPAPSQQDWQQVIQQATQPRGTSAPADQQQLQQLPPAELLRILAIDVSALPLRPGEPTTTDEALGDLLYGQWEQAYRGAVAEVMQEGDGDPWALETQTALQAEARQLATGRLDLYERRLKRFLAGNPSEDELAEWIAHRASTDADVWARQDSLAMRRRAHRDFYRTNPQRTQGRWQIVPASAAEPRCMSVAGAIYPSYQEAADALAGVTHINCIHWLAPVDEGRTA